MEYKLLKLGFNMVISCSASCIQIIFISRGNRSLMHPVQTRTLSVAKDLRPFYADQLHTSCRKMIRPTHVCCNATRRGLVGVMVQAGADPRGRLG